MIRSDFNNTLKNVNESIDKSSTYEHINKTEKKRGKTNSLMQFIKKPRNRAFGVHRPRVIPKAGDSGSCSKNVKSDNIWPARDFDKLT